MKPLAKKTTNALHGIDFALAAIAQIPRQPGEFTCNELHEKLSAQGDPRSRESVHSKLQRMEKSGQLLARSILIDGHNSRLYRQP